MSSKPSDDGLQGVEKKAREAADSLEGPEAGELEKARRSTGAGEARLRHKAPRREGDHPHDANLDHGLEETFPASDPVSISPGSD
jgi:hypothetical protein